MNRFTRIVCFALLLSALMLLALGVETRSQFSASADPLKASAEKVSGDRFTTRTITDRGTVVYSTRRLSESMLNAIDEGLSDLFSRARSRENGYAKGLRHGDYTVYVGNADRTKNAAGEYSPDIAVGAAQYAGSKYDKGGYIYAAGMVLSPVRKVFLIAEHTKDFDRVARVVRYEGEHIVLYHNDRKKFRDTMDHSRGGGHPILK